MKKWVPKSKFQAVRILLHWRLVMEVPNILFFDSKLSDTYLIIEVILQSFESISSKHKLVQALWNFCFSCLFLISFRGFFLILYSEIHYHLQDILHFYKQTLQHYTQYHQNICSVHKVDFPNTHCKKFMKTFLFAFLKSDFLY